MPHQMHPSDLDRWWQHALGTEPHWGHGAMPFNRPGRRFEYISRGYGLTELTHREQDRGLDMVNYCVLSITFEPEYQA